MEKEFVPYEQALALKELGFDEPCFTYYTSNNYGFWKIEKYNCDKDCRITFSQAFRCFREKYNLKGHVEAVEYLDGTPNTYHWCIFNKCNSGNDQLTYEEAELECLKKLISIVK